MSYFLWSYHIRDNGVERLQTIQDASHFLNKHNVQNYYILNTCNRVEILVNSKGVKLPKNIFPELKCKFSSDIRKIISHLLKVSLSVDSIVFGENQILGQMKKALIDQSSHTGTEINKLLQLVFRESKSIRAHTELSRFQTSVSSVAAKFIQNKTSKSAKILLVGYGETNQLLLKSLEKKKYSGITLTNRTQENIINTKAKKMTWSDFLNAQFSEKFDVICLATASKKKILTQQILETAEPKFVIDLCLPANADKKLVMKARSQYLGLDDIEKILKANNAEVKKVKAEIKSHLLKSSEKIFVELSSHSLNDYISDKIQELERIHQEAQKDLNAALNNFTEDQIKTLTSWSSQLVKKLNHLHLIGYKEAFQIGLKKNDHTDRNSRK